VATYTRDQHDVLVVEQSRARAHAVEEELGVKVLVGDADEPAVLLEAGVDRADVFLASTGHDEDNLVASLLAKNEFKVRKVIAAVRNRATAGCTTAAGASTWPSTRPRSSPS